MVVASFPENYHLGELQREKVKKENSEMDSENCLKSSENSVENSENFLPDHHYKASEDSVLELAAVADSDNLE